MSLYLRASLSLASLAVVIFAGCVSRAIIKPRSEVLKEAEDSNLPLPSIEEDRAIFLESEKIQQDRLMEIVQQRAKGEFRDQSYRIGAGDEVEINVFDVPELNLTARVGAAGFISLPLVGGVKAIGATESELKETLKKRLAAYVRSPEVSVFISNYGSQKVAVLGAINKAGTYPLKKGANSILELISEAGGVSDRAGNIVNFIPSEFTGVSTANDVEARARLSLASRSSGPGRPSGITLYLDQVLGTSGGIPIEIPVKGGDIIVIPESGKVTVDGEVQKIGAYELGRQMTLLGALAAAGGITYGAKVDEVEVVREIGLDRKARLVLDLTKIARGEDSDVRLRSGDIVVVPSDSGKRVAQDTFEGITKIINFGVGGTVSLGP